MVLAACFTLIFHRINGDTPDSESHVVAFPVSARAFDGGESLTGYASHPLPLVTRLQAEHRTFAEHLQYVRGELFDVLNHQQFSARDIIAELSGSERPFQMPAVRFNFDSPQLPDGLNGVEVRYQSLPLRYMPMDLFLDVLSGMTVGNCVSSMRPTCSPENIPSSWRSGLKAC